MKRLLSAVAAASVFALMAPTVAMATPSSIGAPSVSSTIQQSSTTPVSPSGSSGGSSASVFSFASLPVTVMSKKASAKKTTKMISTTLNGKTKFIKISATPKVNGKMAKANAGRTVNLQKYSNSQKKWTKYRTTRVSSKGTFSFTLPKNMGATSLRLSMPSTKNFKAYTSPKTTIKRTKPASSASVDKALHVRTVPWQQNKIYGWVDVGSKQKSTVELQERKPGSSWKTVAKKTNISRGGVTFNTPRGYRSSPDMKVQYRISVKDTKLTKGKTTKAITVQWDNPNNGSKTERDAHNYIKNKCPNTAIIMSSSISDGSAASGTAQMGKNTITIGTNTIPYYLETLALHECAHLKQWELYKSDWINFENRMNRIHGTKGDLGMERNAHCIAHQWAANSFWTYGTTESMCTTGETGKAARAIAQGKKY